MGALCIQLCQCMVKKYHSVAQGCSYVTNHSEFVDLQVVYCLRIAGDELHIFHKWQYLHTEP